jgi:phospholipid/cholesterol/gamma-HCH transport system permease protein
MATTSQILEGRANLEPTLTARILADRLTLAVAGPWTVEHARTLERLTRDAPRRPRATNTTIDASGIVAFDTLGAWLVERLLRRFKADGIAAEISGLPGRFRGLLDEMGQVNRKPPSAPVRLGRIVAGLDRLGRAAFSLGRDAVSLLETFGALGTSIGRTLLRPRGFRFTSTVHHLNRVGLQAVPIMLLITFLIGGIIAQQGIFHFRRFGADTFVVDMVGILVLREIGVLIVSIMAAGRSGSAYTAELGSMKMREEIDALSTMGFSPVDFLIAPRVIALVIALPVLAFLGSMSALFGGGLVAWLYGGMSPEIFVERLREAISITHFNVGMIKAPFMALVIGLVACSEGLKVKGSAESLGLQTTTSVVKSIFLVIVLDGVFAIFFASIGM